MLVGVVVPRLRRASGATGTVPAELRDVDNLTWASPSMTKRWLAVQGLSTDGPTSYETLEAVSNAARFVVAAERWVVAQGDYRTYGDATYRWPNFSGYVESGLAIREAQKRASDEWLESVTVVWESDRA